MTRKEIYDEIEKERAYQDGKWGVELDKGHDQYHWVAFITQQAAKALQWGSCNRAAFRKAMLKVAAVAVAALERLEDVHPYNPPQ